MTANILELYAALSKAQKHHATELNGLYRANLCFWTNTNPPECHLSRQAASDSFCKIASILRGYRPRCSVLSPCGNWGWPWSGECFEGTQGGTLMTQRGFSLIEMLLVITIIGLVGVIAIPRMRDSVERANVRAARVSLANNVSRARATLPHGCPRSKDETSRPAGTRSAQPRTPLPARLLTQSPAGSRPTADRSGLRLARSGR